MKLYKIDYVSMFYSGWLIRSKNRSFVVAHSASDAITVWRVNHEAFPEHHLTGIACLDGSLLAR